MVFASDPFIAWQLLAFVDDLRETGYVLQAEYSTLLGTVTRAHQKLNLACAGIVYSDKANCPLCAAFYAASEEAADPDSLMSET
jgi:hypothetical protein